MLHKSGLKMNEKAVYEWFEKENLLGKKLLGQVTSLFKNKKNESYGFITIYNEGKILIAPDGEKVDYCYFWNKKLKLNIDDWVVCKVEDSSIKEKDKIKNNHKNIYAMRVVKDSLQLIEETKDLKLNIFLKKIDSPSLSFLLKNNYLNSIFIFQQRRFIAKTYVDKIKLKIEQEIQTKQDELDKEIEKQKKERAKIDKDKADLEKQKSILKEEREFNKLYEDELKSHEDKLNQQLIRWGLKQDANKQAEEQLFSKFTNEQELIKNINQYINAQGYNFKREDIINLYTCFKTGAMTILAGLSGSGKSSLVRLFAKAINANFTLVSVKATWNDDADLLGFYHPEQKNYISTNFLDTILKAEANRDQLFFVCLDEMNLSKIEHYFSEFLSVLEQDKDNRKLQLYSELEYRNKQEKSNLRQIPYQIFIPNNLFIFGTINIDETTHPLSDKVLDRIQIIQFEAVDFTNKIKKDDSILPVKLDFDKYKEYCKKSDNILTIEWFNDLNKILLEGGFHFGHRVKQHIEDYCALYPEYHSNNDNIIDIQIIQKILPKIKGFKSEEIKNMFNKLRDEFDGKYPKTLAKIEKMEKMDAINYWETF